MTIEDRLTILERTLTRVENLLGTLVGENKPQKDGHNRFMNLAQASSMTGLTQHTLRCYCNRGEITYTKVGNRLILHTDSLFKYITEKARVSIRERAEQLSKPKDKQ